MQGFAWKCNTEEALARRRRFFRRQMQDGVLATLPVQLDATAAWAAFDQRWGERRQGARRPFPSNEEIFARSIIGLEQRAGVEDDSLPVCYSTLDAGESMVAGLLGRDMRFLHRPRGPAISEPAVLLPDYADIETLAFSLDYPWTRRFLEIQQYFADHAKGMFAQHPCLTMDALNFVCEVRGATQAYLDVYEHPVELQRLMEIGLDSNVRYQGAQQELIGPYEDGSFVWLGGWVPFPAAVSLSVDAYVVCSPDTYAGHGFEFQARLIQRFGHGLMHFHCNRTDLAAEVAKLPGLELFQFGGDPNDPRPEVDLVPDMRASVGDIPMMTGCPLDLFRDRLRRGALPPNVWYHVGAGPEDRLSIDEANRLMDEIRAYRC